MSSSRIDAALTASLAANTIDVAESAPEELDAEPRAARDIRPRGWFKRLLPRTMFGRSLLIVVVPLILLQAIAAWIFYDRHWAAVSWRLSNNVAGDVALMIEAIKLDGSGSAASRLLDDGAALTDLEFTLRHGERLPPP